ncbi:agaA33 [Symbiodinium natans]|uniref:AgaA33 protein n=1 Tax=Symbiodinium natans TaxID=878477 RepID=A0A812PUL2_9DINO|nr:agaA33 [Symbiodinium natans]
MLPRIPETDTDLDGVPDCIDQCPSDANKVLIGGCGCGLPDVDSDNDGMPDCLDRCPNNANVTAINACGCDDTDTDGDGVLDCIDLCFQDPQKTTEGKCGCNVADTDTDGDGVPDCYDACPGTPDVARDGLNPTFGGFVTAAGGTYSLCWCSASFDCSTPDVFVISVGSLTIIGPSPLTQHRTCVAGQACHVDSLEGTHLNAQDQFAVLATCGSLTEVGGLPNSGWFTSNLTVQGLGFQDVRITGQGGTYRLCWCAHDQGCTKPAQFRVDLGQFHVVGPAPLEQSWTCINGQTCSLDSLTGIDLAEYDRVVVMETCMVNQVGRFPWTVLPLAASASGSSYQFEPERLTSGQYRLCWCATGMSCSTFEDFSIDVGALNLVGPSPLQQDRTCVAGQTCNFEGFSAFGSSTGGASGMGTIWILSTCGSDGDQLERLPQGGQVQGRSPRPSWGCSAAAGDSDGDGNPDFLDLCPVDPSQSQPGLCGCGVPDTDSDADGTADCFDSCPSDPLKSSPGTCGCGTSDTDSDSDGVPDCMDRCPSDAAKALPGICGCGVADTDSDGDGVPDCVDDCPGAPDQTPPVCGCTAATLDLDGDGTNNCFDGCPLDPAKITPGTCGCGLADTDSDSDGTPDCNDGCPSDAAKTAPGQCGCGAADTDTDSDLTADCNDLCPGDSNKVVPGKCGCGISDVDSDNDGVPDCYDRCPGLPDYRPPEPLSMYTFGEARLSSAGGLYRLCWCSPDAHCQSQDDFAVDVGGLTVIGPSLHQQRTCLSGRRCRVGGMDGSLLSGGDQVLVLDTCSLLSDANISMSPQLEAQLNRYNGSDLAAFASTGALELAGGTYRLCWCAGGFTCSSLPDFHVDFGSMLVIGPRPLREQHATCFTGQTCTLQEIAGNYFGDGDGIMLLETCGLADSMDSPSLTGFQTFLDVPSSVSVSFEQGASTLSAVSTSTSSAGGIYRLCWCANVTIEATPSECGADVGALYLLGPRPLQQDRTCIAGSSCVLNGITGIGLSSGDRLLVLNTCNLGLGQKHAETEFFVSASGVWQVGLMGSMFVMPTDVVGASGGSYRLCWCATPCSMLSHYSVDMGQLTVTGPLALREQHRTCISGQICNINPIQGWFLTTGDSYILLETCGDTVIVPGIPNSGRFTSSIVSMPGGVGSARSFAGLSLSTLSAAGGLYRICWCAGATSCEQTSSFDVDVGQILLVGPQPLNQDRTCVSGQPCLLDAIAGVALSTADRYHILDTCGSSPGPPKFTGAGVDEVNSSLRLSESIVSWGQSPVTAPGGSYRICWCAAGQVCSAAEDFVIDIGGLTLVGPTPLISGATCVAGQTCVVAGISGNFLSAADAGMLLDTCGVPATTPGLTGISGIPLTSDGTSLRLEGSGLQGTPVTAPGGEYRICWCAGGFDCSLAENFISDIGQLMLIGPSPLAQDRTCLAGRVAGCGTICLQHA